MALPSAAGRHAPGRDTRRKLRDRPALALTVDLCAFTLAGSRLCHLARVKARMDARGRVVVPKILREQFGLRAGVVLEIHAHHGSLVLEPAATAVRLVRRGAHLVAEPTVELPTLSDVAVRDTLDRIRR